MSKKEQRYYDRMRARGGGAKREYQKWIYQSGRIHSAILSYLKKLMPKNIVELGIGKGNFALKVSNQEDQEISYIGIDISIEGVRIANDKIRNQRFHFLLANALYLPFRSKNFHLAICSEVFEHVREKRKLLLEINRVLKTDRSLILTTPNPKSLLYTVPRLIDKVLMSLGAGGFRYGSHQLIEEQMEPKELMRMLKNTFFSILDYRGLVFQFFFLERLEHLVKKTFKPIRLVSEYFERKNIFRFLGLYQVILARACEPLQAPTLLIS